MSMRTITVILLGLTLGAGCAAPASPDDATCDDLAHAGHTRCRLLATSAALATANGIKDVPAVNQQRYPDSIGYLYQGSLATILWLQNQPRVARIDDLARGMSRLMQRGVSGEILTSAMEGVAPVPDVQPSLQQLSTRAVQSVRLMTQYAAVTGDYEGLLGSALNTYNADPARQRAISDSAAHVDGELRRVATAKTAGRLPAPPPPANQRMMRPGKYFADAVKDHAGEHLASSVNRLQRAIASRNVAAYAVAFGEVFFRLRDINLAKTALEAMAVHHVDGILRGQPLDTVIANYVASRDPGHPFAVDQLSLINQINLLSNDTSKSRRALVAALLLIDEDHRQAEADPTLSSSLIWQHVGDATWLVSQLVRIKAGSTTDAQVNALIDSVVASI